MKLLLLKFNIDDTIQVNAGEWSTVKRSSQRQKLSHIFQEAAKSLSQTSDINPQDIKALAKQFIALNRYYHSKTNFFSRLIYKKQINETQTAFNGLMVVLEALKQNDPGIKCEVVQDNGMQKVLVRHQDQVQLNKFANSIYKKCLDENNLDAINSLILPGLETLDFSSHQEQGLLAKLHRLSKCCPRLKTIILPEEKSDDSYPEIYKTIALTQPLFESVYAKTDRTKSLLAVSEQVTQKILKFPAYGVYSAKEYQEIYKKRPNLISIDLQNQNHAYFNFEVTPLKNLKTVLLSPTTKELTLIESSNYENNPKRDALYKSMILSCEQSIERLTVVNLGTLKFDSKSNWKELRLYTRHHSGLILSAGSKAPKMCFGRGIMKVNKKNQIKFTNVYLRKTEQINFLQSPELAMGLTSSLNDQMLKKTFQLVKNAVQINLEGASQITDKAFQDDQGQLIANLLVYPIELDLRGTSVTPSCISKLQEQCPWIKIKYDFFFLDRSLEAKNILQKITLNELTFENILDNYSTHFSSHISRERLETFFLKSKFTSEEKQAVLEFLLTGYFSPNGNKIDLLKKLALSPEPLFMDDTNEDISTVCRQLLLSCVNEKNVFEMYTFAKENNWEDLLFKTCTYVHFLYLDPVSISEVNQQLLEEMHAIFYEYQDKKAEGYQCVQKTLLNPRYLKHEDLQSKLQKNESFLENFKENHINSLIDYVNQTQSNRFLHLKKIIVKLPLNEQKIILKSSLLNLNNTQEVNQILGVLEGLIDKKKQQLLQSPDMGNELLKLLASIKKIAPKMHWLKVRAEVLKIYFSDQVAQQLNEVKSFRKALDNNRSLSDIGKGKLLQLFDKLDTKLKKGKPVSILKWTHCTKSDNLEPILEAGAITVQHQGRYAGAYVSSSLETDYGEFAFGMDKTIEEAATRDLIHKFVEPEISHIDYVQRLESGVDREKQQIKNCKKIWVGFQRDIPIRIPDKTNRPLDYYGFTSFGYLASSDTTQLETFKKKLGNKVIHLDMGTMSEYTRHLQYVNNFTIQYPPNWKLLSADKKYPIKTRIKIR